MAQAEHEMNAREYETMFKVEEQHWWYRGLRGILFYWTHRIFEQEGGRPLRVLDAGCGTGINLTKHEQRGFDVYGVDASSDAIAFAKKRGAKHVDQAKIQKLPFADQFFEVIYSMDVLYMLNEAGIKEAMSEFKRCLKPGGYLLLNSATLQFLYSSHDVATNGVSRHSLSLLRKILLDSGFEIKKKSYRLFFLFPLIASVKLLQKIEFKKKGAQAVEGDLEKTNPLLNFLFYPVMAFENWLLRFMDLPIGTSVFIVARLPKSGL